MSIRKKDAIFSSTYRSNICKRLRVLVFCKNMGKNAGKNISKYSRKLLDHAKQSAAIALKTSSKKQSKK